MSFLKNFFVRRSQRRFETIVARINERESSVQALTDEAMLDASRQLKDTIAKSAATEDDTVQAFALVREAARRTLEQRPFDVQLLGGLVLHSGAVAEMTTGEGKTLSAVAPVYLNALSGKGAHVVTVNEYLARRDAVWMGQIYNFLGLSVACLVPSGAFLYDPKWRVEEAEAIIDKERDNTGSFLVQQEYLRPITRREAYLADITYGTNHEFGFDYLRDNLTYQLEEQVQRGHPFAIIDEVDSILIDEARTPLIIAAPDEKSSEFYKTFSRVVENLKQDEDFELDEKQKSVRINDSGIEKVEKLVGIQNIYSPENMRLVHYLEESLRAKTLFRRDRDYVVKNDEIIIVDEFTGRLLQGRRYNGGLHQAIEAKEGVRIQEESRTYAKISIQNYFRLYEKISGMTGTAQTSAEEFHKVYNLEVISVPTHRTMVRKDFSDVIYKTFEAKLRAICRDVKERWEKGQPVLIGTTSIEKNEIISSYLNNAGVPHEVLNAKNNEREGSIIAQAGRLKGVTVATNMAGRGVDILLGGNPPDPEEGKRVRELGGLYVVGTERHEARRIDDQLRGRSGRQGDQGASQFFLSLEDDLLRVFGGDRIKSLMDRFHLPEDEPIQMKMVSRAVAEAQAKVEGANFDMRKHLLEYDDVLNKQRSAVYTKRQEILTSLNKQTLAGIIFEAAHAHYESLIASNMPIEEMKKHIDAAGLGADIPISETEPIGEQLSEQAKNVLTKKSFEVTLDPQTLARVLSILDMLWMNHLDDLEALSESVRLRAYGQKDPLVEYRRDAHGLFKNFWSNFNGWIFMNIFKLAQLPQDGKTASFTSKQLPAAKQPDNQHKNIGRNDSCWCGSGKKYKRCHGA